MTAQQISTTTPAIDPFAPLDSDFAALSASEAARLLPGRPPHPASVHRWMTRGLKGGIKLESKIVGGERRTSREAMRRFFDRITAAADGVPMPIRTPRQRQKAIEQAEAELAEHGI